jgi:hypothetical protein
METNSLAGSLAVIASLAILSCTLATAQTNLNFNSVSVTVEGAIRLSWNSTTNEVYEIDYANDLIDTNTGTITWLPLYTDYPSHGTNTFWLDTGDYFLEPPIPHPSKTPARFYRIVLLGTNTDVAPNVSITSPAQDAVVSGNVTVAVNASSTHDLVRTILYVDGQEMKPSIDGTNFLINTCEWPNGSHTLFAVAKSQLGLEGQPNDTSVLYGRAVSPYVTVTFDNLITRFSWTEPYFEPALGQTQQVTAAFAANVNWTLQIQDANTNTVLATSGSGTSMAYNWDGTGQSGTNLSAGIYTYFLSASTNGRAFSADSEQGGGAESISAAVPSSGATSSQGGWYPRSADEARAAGWTSYFIEFPPLPPHWSNGVWVIPETPRPIEVTLPQVPQQTLGAGISSDSGDAAPDILDANTPRDQQTRGPLRTPNIPGQGTIGTVGVGYQTYQVPGSQFTTPPIQKTPPPIQTFIALDGISQNSAHNPETWGQVLENSVLANRFLAAMKDGRWAPRLLKPNDDFTTADLLNGAFNNSANVAPICLHGSYASTAELDGIRHTYLRFRDSKSGSTSYVKTDQIEFGGSGTNGLKWVALAICSALEANCYNDMYNNELLPITEDLHLLLGAASLMTAAPDLGELWARNMLGTYATNGSPMTVEEAWYAAGKNAYTRETDYPNLLMNFRVAGWPDAFSDHLSDRDTSPGTSNPADIIYHQEKVHPLP